MKPEQLFDAMGQISPEYIEEAKPKQVQPASGMGKQAEEPMAFEAVALSRTSGKEPKMGKMILQRFTTGAVVAASLAVFAGGGFLIAKQKQDINSSTLFSDSETNFLGGKGEIVPLTAGGGLMSPLILRDAENYYLTGDEEGFAWSKDGDNTLSVKRDIIGYLSDGEQIYSVHDNALWVVNSDGSEVYFLGPQKNEVQQIYHLYDNGDVKTYLLVIYDAKLENEPEDLFEGGIMFWKVQVRQNKDGSYTELAYGEVIIPPELIGCNAFGGKYLPELHSIVYPTVKYDDQKNWLELCCFYLGDYTDDENDPGVVESAVSIASDCNAWNLWSRGCGIEGELFFYVDDDGTKYQVPFFLNEYNRIDLKASQQTVLRDFDTFFYTDNRFYTVGWLFGKHNDNHVTDLYRGWENPEYVNSFDADVIFTGGVNEPFRTWFCGYCFHDDGQDYFFEYLIPSDEDGMGVLEESSLYLYNLTTDTERLLECEGVREDVQKPESTDTPASFMNFMGGEGEMRVVMDNTSGMQCVLRDNTYDYLGNTGIAVTYHETENLPYPCKRNPSIYEQLGCYENIYRTWTANDGQIYVIEPAAIYRVADDGNLKPFLTNPDFANTMDVTSYLPYQNIWHIKDDLYLVYQKAASNVSDAKAIFTLVEVTYENGEYQSAGYVLDTSISERFAGNRIMPVPEMNGFLFNSNERRLVLAQWAEAGDSEETKAYDVQTTDITPAGMEVMNWTYDNGCVWFSTQDNEYYRMWVKDTDTAPELLLQDVSDIIPLSDCLITLENGVGCCAYSLDAEDRVVLLDTEQWQSVVGEASDRLTMNGETSVFYNGKDVYLWTIGAEGTRIYQVNPRTGEGELREPVAITLEDVEPPEIPEPIAIPFTADCVRTDGYHEGTTYPETRRFEDALTLEEYAHIWGQRYDFDSDEWKDTMAKYDDAFFETHNLLLITWEENSGSIQPEVTGLRYEVTNIQNTPYLLEPEVTSHIPEVSTDDMAQWHLFIAFDKQYSYKNCMVSDVIRKVEQE